MGRPQEPLARDGSPVREFAFWLRNLRRHAGLTYEELGRRAHYATSTVQAAASGKRLPTLRVTLAYVGACDGNVRDWHAYWTQIRRALDPDIPKGAVPSILPPWADREPGPGDAPGRDAAAQVPGAAETDEPQDPAGEDDGWYVESFSALLHEAAIRAAVDNLGGGNLAAAATATFGLGRGERDMPAQNRRRRAAMAYGVSVERFRKHHERIVIEQVAEEILKMCAPLAAPATVRVPRADLAPQISLSGQVGEHRFPVVVHVEPAELLSGVDILVVPENVYLELPQHFKSSVAAAVRKASAVKNADGEIINDVVADELHSWVRSNGRIGLPVAPGTVAPGGPGQMAQQRIRRIYHAAIAMPIAGTNYYDIEPASIATAVRNALALARAEQALFDPALSSIAFPLFGAGRGALDPAVSFAWLWTALEREIRQYGPWEVHFVTRRRLLADLIVAKLREAGAIAPEDD